MTTLANNSPRAYEIGERNTFSIGAGQIIYEGSAVGLVDATGLARPLVAGDRFAGFSEAAVNNPAANLAVAQTIVRTLREGSVQLPVAGAVITDVGQPVYASDDDTFTFVPTGNSFIGFARRWVSAGVMVVEFDPDYTDPYGEKRATLSGNTTLDATYDGKCIFIDTDAVTITLPAVEGLVGLKIINIGAFGTVAVTVAPNAADMIEGPGITAADNKAIVNTKATARRGDFIEIEYSDANGWGIRAMRGTWARAA